MPFKPGLIHRLWGFTENALWYGWRPKWFWAWLLRRLDAYHGLYPVVGVDLAGGMETCCMARKGSDGKIHVQSITQRPVVH